MKSKADIVILFSMMLIQAQNQEERKLSIQILPNGDYWESVNVLYHLRYNRQWICY